MSYLQLADNGDDVLPQEILEYMLQIPREGGGTVWVREDQLDHLPDETLYMIMQQQPHMSGIRDWFARSKERKAERFARREGKRTTRSERKGGTWLERITGATQGIIGSIKGEPGYDEQRGQFLPQVTGGLNIGVAKWWQNPAVIGLGLVIVVVGGIAYVKAQKK